MSDMDSKIVEALDRYKVLVEKSRGVRDAQVVFDAVVAEKNVAGDRYIESIRGFSDGELHELNGCIAAWERVEVARVSGRSDGGRDH